VILSPSLMAQASPRLKRTFLKKCELLRDLQQRTAQKAATKRKRVESEKGNIIPVAQPKEGMAPISTNKLIFVIRFLYASMLDI